MTIPAVKNSVCTSAQISSAVTACLGASATQATCSTFVSDASNKACLLGCMITGYANNMGMVVSWTGNPVPSASAPWGSLVTVANPGQQLFYDIGGCIKLADPGQAACGDSVNALLQCEVASCSGNCPVPTQGTASAIGAAQSAYQSCVTSADSGGCAMYAAAEQSCLSALPDGGTVSICLNQGSSDPNAADQALIQMAGLFCGP